MTSPTVRLARPDEHELVSALALRSKGHWGYSAEFLESCRAELTYGAETCGSGRMWLAEDAGTVVGFGLLGGEPPEGELVALFVDPDAIGAGVGGLLLRHLLDRAAHLGFRRLVLDADPGAAPFYRHHGAVDVGSVPSGSVPGRVLPQLAFELSSTSGPRRPSAGTLGP